MEGAGDPGVFDPPGSIATEECREGDGNQTSQIWGMLSKSATSEQQ